MDNRKSCIVCVGKKADEIADRIEKYAKDAGFQVRETIFKNAKSVDQMKYYIERDSIICVLVSDINDISADKRVVRDVMELAAEHGISINAESRGFEPALISFEEDNA